ncbi:hypothetical protein V6Z12_A13G242300 [Gossypium hirsutum]
MVKQKNEVIPVSEPSNELILEVWKIKALIQVILEQALKNLNLIQALKNLNLIEWNKLKTISKIITSA